MKTAASGNNNHKIKDTLHAPRQWSSFPEPCIGGIFQGTSGPAVFSPVEPLAEKAAARWKGNIRTPPSAVSPAAPLTFPSHAEKHARDAAMTLLAKRQERSIVPRMYYITTAIDYTNGPPHIGHAYEKVLADVLARWHRMKGEEVYFLTGVDQHGQKVQQTAEKLGITPQEHVNNITGQFLALWDRLGISNDGWASTTDPRHKACVQKILTDLKDKGQLYKKSYKGFYSVRQEQFLTDKERDAEGNFGPEWGEVVELEEENWYFRLTDHVEWMKQFVEKSSDFVLPSFRKAEVLNAIDFDSDLCISRPKSRLSWGIEFPFDPEFVTYVWFDALINYISFAGYLAEPDSGLPDFAKLWPADCEVIGKDILVPAHGVYWPAMLHAMGFSDEEMPTLLVHGWWNINGEKMSKSIGNVIAPQELIDKYGADALRFSLVMGVSPGNDMRFSTDKVESARNFANKIWNASRFVLMNMGDEAETLEGKTLCAAERSHSGIGVAHKNAKHTVALCTPSVICSAAYVGCVTCTAYGNAIGFCFFKHAFIYSVDCDKSGRVVAVIFHDCAGIAYLAYIRLGIEGAALILPDVS